MILDKADEREGSKATKTTYQSISTINGFKRPVSRMGVVQDLTRWGSATAVRFLAMWLVGAVALARSLESDGTYDSTARVLYGISFGLLVLAAGLRLVNMALITSILKVLTNGAVASTEQFTFWFMSVPLLVYQGPLTSADVERLEAGHWTLRDIHTCLDWILSGIAITLTGVAEVRSMTSASLTEVADLAAFSATGSFVIIAFAVLKAKIEKRKKDIRIWLGLTPPAPPLTINVPFEGVIKDLTTFGVTSGSRAVVLVNFASVSLFRYFHGGYNYSGFYLASGICLLLSMAWRAIDLCASLHLLRGITKTSPKVDKTEALSKVRREGSAERDDNQERSSFWSPKIWWAVDYLLTTWGGLFLFGVASIIPQSTADFKLSSSKTLINHAALSSPIILLVSWWSAYNARLLKKVKNGEG